MYDLQLKRGGALVSQEWNSDAAKFIEKEVSADELIFHFNDVVCLATGVTLKDIFLLISKAVEIFSIVTGCPFLDELVAEALSKVEAGEKGIVALELKRIAVVHDMELFFHFDFHGLGEKDTYAIEFTPINELTTYPLILNEDIALEDGKTEQVYLKCKMGFTLVDILIGIIEELSYMGPPDVRQIALEELRKRADEVQEGNVETTSWEALRKRLEEEDNKNKIPCKICGKDARTQCFDKPSDICVACFERIKEN